MCYKLKHTSCFKARTDHSEVSSERARALAAGGRSLAWCGSVFSAQETELSGSSGVPEERRGSSSVVQLSRCRGLLGRRRRKREVPDTGIPVKEWTVAAPAAAASV